MTNPRLAKLIMMTHSLLKHVSFNLIGCIASARFQSLYPSDILSQENNSLNINTCYFCGNSN